MSSGAPAGLTAVEVEARRARGLGNDLPATNTRTFGQILRANLLTRFNLLLGGPTFALFWAGGVAEANRIAPVGLGATAQGALGSVMFGLGSAAGNFLGGAVFERYGGPVLMQAVGWVLAAALAVFVAVRLWPRHAAPVAVEKGPSR